MIKHGLLQPDLTTVLLRARALQRRRGKKLILICSRDDKHRLPTDEDVVPLFEILSDLAFQEEIDLFVFGVGGSIDTVHRFITLLQEMVPKYTCLVPSKCWSAFTLFGLAATDIACLPTSELSPLDPHLISSTSHSSQVSSISSEEIRLFMDMAEKWFKLSEDNALGALQAVTQKIFPSSLTSFFRADQNVQQIIEKILVEYASYSAENASQITHQLLHGYRSHSASIRYREMVRIGLNAIMLDPVTAKLVWSLHLEVQHWLRTQIHDREAFALIGSTRLVYAYLAATFESSNVSVQPNALDPDNGSGWIKLC